MRLPSPRTLMILAYVALVLNLGGILFVLLIGPLLTGSSIP